MERVCELCSECRTCELSCPRNAIKMRMDDEGFSYPTIDNDVCIDCGLCQKVCSLRNADALKYSKGAVYAAQSLESEILKDSTSGGVFSLISSFVFDKGGVVVGAAYQNHLQVRHIIVDNKKELHKLRGAKYVQSDVGDVPRRIENMLRKKKWVYFTGTPCQVAGLKSYLRRNYPTLITSDLFCHGTPSQKIFDAFVKQIEVEQESTIDEVIFRDKSIAGWGAFPSFIKNNKGMNHKVIYDRNLRAYYKAFVEGLITRKDCFSCPFASPERTGDITIADYWDVEYIHPHSFDIYKGVSLVIVNSQIGEEIWDKIKSQTHFVESSVDLVMKTTNHQFQHPLKKPEGRDTSALLAIDSVCDFVNKKLPPHDKKIFFKEVVKNRLWKFSFFRKFVRLVRNLR